MIVPFLVSSISFARATFGLIRSPYQSYRRLVSRADIRELAVILFGCGLYFTAASLLRVSEFRPFLLTRQFSVLTVGAGTGFLLTVGFLSQTGRMLGSTVDIRKISVGWGYTLVPTLVWFWVTSILYVILPPPRTGGPLGILFSIVFLLFSAVMLFWKITLVYLTLRFSLRLDFPRIGMVIALGSIVLGAYSIIMYRLGIFRIPFL